MRNNSLVMVMKSHSVGLLCFSVLVVFTSLFQTQHASPIASQSNVRPFRLRKLCKFCDVSPSVCTSSGICTSRCSITSICPREEEICAAAWRRDKENVTVETVCHSLSEPFHGVMPEYNTTECVMKQYRHLGPDVYICFCGEEECNDRLVFTPTDEPPPQPMSLTETVLLIVVPFVVLAIMLMSFVYVCRLHVLLPGKLRPDSGHEHSVLIARHFDSISNHLNHNTELLPIRLDGTVGKGRFAQVHRGWLGHKTGEGQAVAVKIFTLEEFLSWKAECEIFLDAELRHENVLHFLTAEERPAERQFWIITAFHRHGNLRDYLRARRFGWAALCSMGGDVARGVAHLHGDRTEAGRVKAVVAHRDLKSDNVLVRDDLSCCICDFGLSVRLDSDMSRDELANQGQVGTVRYMAPEVLESRLNLENIESFKQADIYSLALVLWEITSRCSANRDVREYEPPFGKLDQPCIESMKDTVIRDRERPEIPSSWRTHPGVAAVCEMMVESWDEDPEARLTAHCISERFGKLSRSAFICDSEKKLDTD